MVFLPYKSSSREPMLLLTLLQGWGGVYYPCGRNLRFGKNVLCSTIWESQWQISAAMYFNASHESIYFPHWLLLLKSSANTTKIIMFLLVTLVYLLVISYSCFNDGYFIISNCFTFLSVYTWYRFIYIYIIYIYSSIFLPPTKIKRSLSLIVFLLSIHDYRFR